MSGLLWEISKDEDFSSSLGNLCHCPITLTVKKHVMLPRELSKQVPKSHLMSEEEWRRLGVQQSLGWVHYMIHEPEPHILLFRRPLPKDKVESLLRGGVDFPVALKMGAQMLTSNNSVALHMDLFPAKKRFVSQGIKLSAEVKPFVPKHAAVTVAWSEPSEACVFPRYLTTCYPFVQEPSLDKQQVYAEDLPWDDFSSLSQCPSHSVLGDPAFCEYSSCSYSPDVVSNVCPVAGSQYHSNNSTHYNGSGIVSESAEQTYPIRQESKTLSKQRRSKESEKKLDKKRHGGDDSSIRIMNRTSFQTSACSRDSVKPDRFNKTTNKKSTQTPKTESFPVHTFEATVLDFCKSQSLGSSEILNVQHKSGPEDSSVESKASSKTLDETGASLIPSSFDGRDMHQSESVSEMAGAGRVLLLTEVTPAASQNLPLPKRCNAIVQ
ncbi:PREDICTED: cyclin-dependent kinases regulatory subunit 2 [Charadrius vociferus]|uniref:cyclin-dependent kinases regulatory subunit 2 n=1 Tax=Charadrius vociferus TaxID=50402 RepID=UPI00052137F5|nr:PREDICTED: cyclin-dependent kinases regulatory subunit 2 [Charadrius vociferus]